VLDTEALVEQPLDEFGTLLARRSVETVKQAQRLEIEVCRHVVNLKPHLILRGNAGAAQLHFGLDLFFRDLPDGWPISDIQIMAAIEVPRNRLARWRNRDLT
jgi:hypothetical protein